MDFPPWPIPEWSWPFPLTAVRGHCSLSSRPHQLCNATLAVAFSDECAREGPLREEASCCPRLPGWMAGGGEAEEWEGSLPAHAEHHGSPHPSSSHPPLPGSSLPSSTPRPSFLRAHHSPQRLLVSGNWFLWSHLPCMSKAPHPTSPPKEDEAWTDNPAHDSWPSKQQPCPFSLGPFFSWVFLFTCLI